MQHSSWRDESSYNFWKRRFDRALGHMNVHLVVFAIGLAILDLTCLLAFTATAEIQRAHSPSQQVQPALSQAWPEWLPFPPTPAMASATAQKMDPL